MERSGEGGKEPGVPVRHVLEAFIRAYLRRAWGLTREVSDLVTIRKRGVTPIKSRT